MVNHFLRLGVPYFQVAFKRRQGDEPQTVPLYGKGRQRSILFECDLEMAEIDPWNLIQVMLV